jgi:two-component system response regulator RegA
MTKRFLIIDDDATFTSVLSRSLGRKGFQALTANDADTALRLLNEQPSSASITHIILDLKLVETTGLQLLPQLLAIKPDVQVVLLTGYASVATTVEAMKQGAVNYLCKPASIEEILAAFDDVDSSRTYEHIEDSPLSVDRVEWEYIQRQLAANNGNIAATARALGMHRRTLQRKLQKRPGKF